MFGFILPLVAFYIFVSMFSEGTESQARWKIFTLSFVATTVLFTMSRENPTLIGSTAACLVAALVSFVGLTFWIKVTRSQAVKITGSYVGFVVAYSLAAALIFGNLRSH